MDANTACERCGGSLEISATLIACLQCKTLWGRCEGVWVEVSPEAEKAYQDSQRAFEAWERKVAAQPQGGKEGT